MGEQLIIYTVYHNPLDYPGKFVVRQHLIGKNTVEAFQEIFCIGDSLEEVRNKIPLGLVLIPRSPEDEKQIVESWM